MSVSVPLFLSSSVCVCLCLNVSTYFQCKAYGFTGTKEDEDSVKNTHRMKNSDAFALSGKNERNIGKIENVKERQWDSEIVSKAIYMFIMSVLAECWKSCDVSYSESLNWNSYFNYYVIHDFMKFELVHFVYFPVVCFPA